MPTNKPFFPDLRPVKKVITPTGEVFIRKECKCGREFMGRANQTRCEGMRNTGGELSRPDTAKTVSGITFLTIFLLTCMTRTA
jgi:hypothetical protein